MKLASILPVKNVEQMFQGSYEMLLTHLKDHYPTDKNGNKNCYTIMDNSLIETGDAFNIEKVLEAAEHCNADEIVLPDYLHHGAATIAYVERTLEQLYNLGMLKRFKLMAVCHGTTPEEFEATFKLLERINEIHAIGIPKLVCASSNITRPKLEYIWTGSNKAIHLLGVKYTLKELLEYENPAVIRSVDTCIPALLSKHKMSAWDIRPSQTIDLENDHIILSYYYDIFLKLRRNGITQ